MTKILIFLVVSYTTFIFQAHPPQRIPARVHHFCLSFVNRKKGATLYNRSKSDHAIERPESEFWFLQLFVTLDKLILSKPWFSSCIM